MTDQWYYANNNRREGPVDRARIDELVEAGTITARTLLWGDGMPDWAPASDVLRLPDTVLSTANVVQRGPRSLPEPGFKKAAEKALPVRKNESNVASPWGRENAGTGSPWGGPASPAARQPANDRFGDPAYQDNAPSMTETPVQAPRPRPARPSVPRNITGRANWYSAVFHVLRNFANFRGRDVRWQFWYAFFAAWVAGVAINASDAIDPIFVNGFLLWPAQIFWLVVALPLLAGLVRRLHDVGYPGYLAWLLVIPGLGALILAGMAAMSTQVGDNQYGPEPLQS